MSFDKKISNSLENTAFTTPTDLNMVRNSKIEEQIYLSTAEKGLISRHRIFHDKEIPVGIV